MEIQVLKPAQSGKATKMNVSEALFGAEFNEGLVHQVVTAYLAGARQGSKQQKTRSDVRGSTAKPWRQKGSGRARAGTRKGPIWRGGGVTFAARPRSYSQKVNQKMYRAALASIFSELNRTERLFVVNKIELADHKTKTCIAWLNEICDSRALILTTDVEKNLFLGARNIPGVAVLDITHVDPVSLVHFDNVIITQDALKKIEERFA